MDLLNNSVNVPAERAKLRQRITQTEEGLDDAALEASRVAELKKAQQQKVDSFIAVGRNSSLIGRTTQQRVITDDMQRMPTHRPKPSRNG